MKEYIAEYIVPVEKKGNDNMFDFMNATPLIRCKDCRHFYQSRKQHDLRVCDHARGCIDPDANGFCSNAEPKRHK